MHAPETATDCCLEGVAKCCGRLLEGVETYPPMRIKVPVSPNHKAVRPEDRRVGRRKARHSLEKGRAVKVLRSVPYKECGEHVIVGSPRYIRMGQDGFDFGGEEKCFP